MDRNESSKGTEMKQKSIGRMCQNCPKSEKLSKIERT